eukprot:gnl/Spiro4/22339_TR10995_c0_g1_i1.p1 gnl/Spiro4/22339_TR10995_c0_g1~~gnl/Spiro4/22339_TR10995_c0_g1_i1.p1  ORF type:complete len:406 (-),score=37.78 gnl/Spiro4/22339_TR10995_c0_g1_i1:136-1353(-)
MLALRALSPSITACRLSFLRVSLLHTAAAHVEKASENETVSSGEQEGDYFEENPPPETQASADPPPRDSPRAAICTLGNTDFAINEDERSGVESCGSGVWMGLMRAHDSTDPNRAQWLRGLLDHQGYAFLRDVFPPPVVAAARLSLLIHLRDARMLHPDSTLASGRAPDGMDHSTATDQGRLHGLEKLVQTAPFKRLLEGPEIFRLFRDVFGEPALTLDHKWVRAVAPGESTGFHMDSVYVGGGSPDLLTCWIPFMDIPYELGGLVVCEGTHTHPAFQHVRDTYGRLDLDSGDVGGTGWLSESAEEIATLSPTWSPEFLTHRFRPGDVVLFPLKTLHGSAVNRTNNWRLSCDVRFQPLSHPVDKRWVRNEAGVIPGVQSKWSLHRNDATVFPRTMAEAKLAWGLA